MHWKKWTATHEYEELKEGAWLEPTPAFSRKKVKENWTEKHCNVARKIFLEEGWTQKRMFDIGWSNVSQCQACQIEDGTEKHRLHHCPEWYRVRREISEAFRKSEQNARTSKKEWKWQGGIVVHPLGESQLNRSLFSVRKWESEKHESWGMPTEGFKGHVATDGMSGSMEAEYEVQRTIKRAELTSFLCFLRKVCGLKKGSCGQQGNN